MKFTEVRLPANDLDALAAFYGGRLGLPIIQRNSGELHFLAGGSRLVFVKQSSPQHLSLEEKRVWPQHYAFNVPEHKFDDAKTWLQARCDLIPDEAGHTVIYHENWDAHSLYFYDPDGNIGELIARHTQPTAHAGAFDASALLCVSEVGIVTSDPAATARLACEQLNAAVYRTELNDTFAPVGDEDGLFIIVKAGRLWMPDRVLPAQPSPITVAVAGAPTFNLTPSAHVTQRL